MPKKLCLSAVVELPDNVLQAAGVTFRLSEPWAALCQALKDAGLKYEVKIDELEVRAKSPRPRKPRVVAPAEQAA